MTFLRRRSALLAATLLSVSLSVSLLAPVPALARPAAPPPPPPTTISNATVHDPDQVLVDGTHYVFGSHLQSATSPDLINFNQLTSGVTPDNPLFDDVTSELSEALTWAQSDTLWAPDVIKLRDGRYYMYYDACKGDSPRSALGVAVADRVTGPYRDLGLILKSGMWGEPSEDGSVYDAKVHPNVVDPDVFFDTAGRLWMIYGSYSGGIFILELDPATAKPFPGQGYGKHLWGGNHARIEGPAVMFDPRTDYYYLYVTYGGLDASGGYNIRVARSRQPDGPYLDAQGRDMATVKADPSLPLFDDVSIAPTGVKLMGNYQFQRVVGDPGSGLGVGGVSPGGSSPWFDSKSKQAYLIMHSRFPGRGEEHEVRVHRLELTASGWPVVAPYRYAGERSTAVKRAEQVGTYALIDHAPKTISADVHQARTVRLRQDGTITGAVTGRWHRAGQNRAVLVIDDVRYEAVFGTGWDPDARRWVTTFSGLSADGVALWGARRTW